MARITDEQYQKQVSDSYNQHVATKLRAAYPSIAKDASDDELFAVWRKLTVPDATPDEANQVLQQVYASDWTPPERPAPSLGERVGDIAHGAADFGKNLAQGVAEFTGANAAQKIAGKVPGVGQVAMAVPTAIRLAGHELAGRRLEKTAAEMPAPNIEELRNRGMSEEQIHNIVKGYTDTQNSLMQDVAEQGRGGVTDASAGIANAVFLNPQGKAVQAVENTGKAAVGALLKAGAPNAVLNAAEHGITGAAFGAGYGAVQQASETMGQAAADGAKADEILAAGTKGALRGGVIGGALGGALGGTAGAVASPFVENAARKAASAKSVSDALAVKLQQFGRTFNSAWLRERFPEDLRMANEQGLPDEVLARNILTNTYGPEAANTDAGMRAIGDIFEKIKTWRSVNEGLQGPMVDLPAQPFGPAPVPNIAQPTGAPVEPQVGGVPPNPNEFDMGSIAQRPTPVPPPQGVAPMQGLERMPAPAQGQVPMQLEGVAPQEPAPAAVRLSQPLIAEPQTNRISSPIPSGEPRELGGVFPPQNPEVTYATPPALVAPTPGPVPVRNLGGGPEDFANRQLTGPSAPPVSDRVAKLTAMLQEAIAKNDLKSVVKLTEALKKEVIAQKKTKARAEKSHA